MNDIDGTTVREYCCLTLNLILAPILARCIVSSELSQLIPFSKAMQTQTNLIKVCAGNSLSPQIGCKRHDRIPDCQSLSSRGPGSHVD